MSNFNKLIREFKELPNGVEVYKELPGGVLALFDKDGYQQVEHSNEKISEKLLPFINPGNEAYYLVGNQHSGPAQPAFGTAKFGITKPHHSFLPHAHGARHYVRSNGGAGCVLIDPDNMNPKKYNLPTGTMIVIPEMMSHSFYNRSEYPMVSLIVNTGLGIYNEEYAYTLSQAVEEYRKTEDPELSKIIAELEVLTEFMNNETPEKYWRWKDRLSILFKKLSEFLEL